MISRPHDQPRDRRNRGKQARKRASRKRLLRCEPLEDRRLLAAIFGYKFSDINANGIDDSETRVNGVTFQLFQNGTLFRTTTSADFDADGGGVIDPATERGVFRFENLPAGAPNEFQYEVREVGELGRVQTTSPPPAFQFTSDDEAFVAVGQTTFSGLGDENQQPLLAFGNVTSSSIHGFKFEDFNGNGAVDPADQPLAGVPFQLTGVDALGNNVNLISNTDATGQFAFDNLLPSINGVGSQTGYTVTELLPIGFESSTEPLARTLNLAAGVELVWQDGAANLVAGDPRVEQNVNELLIFGNTARGSIHGFKFDDLNGNGLNDPGEAPLAGITFTLSGSDGAGNLVNLQSVTDASGQFTFTDLWPSENYFVAESLPVDRVATTPPVRSFALTSRQELVWQVGAAMLPPPPTLAVDQSQLNADGTTVTNNVIGQTFTPNVTGELSFLSIGSATTPISGMTLEIQTVSFDPIPVPTGNVLATGGTPQLVDGNLMFSFADPPILVSGIQYAWVLRSPQPVTALAATGNLYLRGTQVTFDNLGGWQSEPNVDLTFTTSMTGSADPRVETLVDDTGDSLQFGNRVGSSIHGFQFMDSDGDGIRDPGELPMAGITFRLSGVNLLGNPVNLQTITDADGEFSFENLLPSVAGSGPQTGYSLVAVTPDGSTSTVTPTDRLINLAGGVELVWQAGAADLDPDDLRVEQLAADDGTELVFGTTTLGSIHGFKFNDNNGNGVRDPGEAGPQGVTFTLTGTDALGNVVNRTSVTDDDGEFQFTSLHPSQDYTVTETVPAGFINTTPLARSFSLSSGEELVWQSGAANLPAPPLPNVDVEQPLSNLSNDGDVFGQTFTPGVTGELTTVVVRTSSTNLVGVSLEVQSLAPVLTSEGTVRLPAGDVLARTTAAQTTTGGLVFDFTVSPSLIAGDQYALVFRSTNQPGSWDFLRIGSDAYSGGDRLTFSDAVGWQVDSASDRAFSTTMTAATDPRFELLAADAGTALMFGNRITSSLHGFKFDDTDGDGQFDPGEPPMPGVTFELTGTDVAGTVVQMVAVTDVTGQFAFTGLLPSIAGDGDQTGYTITEYTPLGFVSTTPLAGGPLDLSAGVELVWQAGAAMLDPDDPRSESVVGEPLMFGNAALGSIHGIKFDDLDGDGIFDTEEPGIPDVIFAMSGIDALGNAVERQVVTDANGEFAFTGLMPSEGYTVTEVTPIGFVSTTPTTLTLPLSSGQEWVWQSGAADLPPPPIETLDQQQTLGNTVNNLPNGGAMGQTFTPAISGTLTSASIAASTELPSANNTLEIQTLVPRTTPGGTILVPSGTVLATAASPRIDGDELVFDFSDPANLIAGVSYALVLRSDQARDWRLQLADVYPGGAQLVFSQLDGWNELAGSDHTFTTAMVGEVDPRQEIVVADDGTALQIGNIAASSLHGFKFLDIDGDGIRDPGESPLANVTFRLTGTNSRGTLVDLVTNTDDAGEFSFTDLLPSVDGEGSQTGYTLTEIVPPGYAATTGTDPRTFDLSAGIELVWQGGAASIGPNDPRTETLVGESLIFGNVAAGSIHGFKFVDTNGNGVRDPGEAAAAGVVFTLTGTDGMEQAVNQTAVTDQEGEFAFTGLLPSENYVVTETLPLGSINTTPLTRSLTLLSGQELVWEIGAARLPVPPVPTLDQQQPQANVAAASSVVGQTFTPGVTGSLTNLSVSTPESSVSEIRVEIQSLAPVITSNGIVNLPTGNVLASSTTNAVSDGWFQFSFAAPPHLIAGTQYAFVVRTTDATQTDRQTNNVYSGGTRLEFTAAERFEIVADQDLSFMTVMVGDEDPRIEVLAADTGIPLIFGNRIGSSIHGFKFSDTDGDGVRDDGEPAVAGVTFRLTGINAAGDAVNLVAITDESGQFHFDHLLPSVPGQGTQTGYTVTEIVPPGFFPTTGDSERPLSLESGIELVWQDGAADLDPDDPRIESNLGAELMFGHAAPGSIHGLKFADTDGDGVRDPGEPGTPGVTFTLTGTNAIGGIINLSSVTDANGEFSFTGLLPSVNYTVTEILSAAFVNTTPLTQSFSLVSGQELVWQTGAADLPAPPTAAIDQQQLLGDSFEFLPAGGQLGQTFTPNVSGTLSAVTITASTIAASADNVLEIQTLAPFVSSTGTRQVPSGLVIGSATAPTQINGNLTFEFAAPPNLVAGIEYAMVLRSSQPRDWRLQPANVYAGGSQWEFDAVDGWRAVSTADHTFTTVMTAAPDPRVEVLAAGTGVPLMFGNTISSSIHGFKFEDINGDGIRDPGDPPQAGVWFRLTGTNNQGSAIDRVAITDATGQFAFENLLPSVIGQGLQTGYTITEVLPAGFQTTTEGSTDPISLDPGVELVWQSGAAGLDIDDPRTEISIGAELIFGNTALGSIHGFKFTDVDADGIRDDNEPVAPGVTFTLTGTDSRGNVINRTAVTNEAGEFWFTNLWPSAAYTVTETVPRGFINTTQLASTFELRSREELVWRSGAAMLPPTPVALIDQAQTLATSFVSVDSTALAAQTFTAGTTGKLSSVDLTVRTDSTPGNVILSVYDVVETGITPTPIAAGRLVGQSTVIGATIPIADRQSLTFNFPALPDLLAGETYLLILESPGTTPGSLLWGLSGESYAGGARFTSTAPLGPPLTDPTQSNPALPPQDHAFTTRMVGQTDPRHEVLVDANNDGIGEALVFANALTSSIHGFKFHDRDADGTYSVVNGDTPLAGVTFLLTGIGRGNVPVNTIAVTDASGQFRFDDLPASVAGQGSESGYTVTELIPGGFLPTTGSVQRVLNLESGVELAWQQGAAMLVPQVDPQLEVVVGQRLMFGNAANGSIHGFKFLDIDGDTIYEPELGERPQAGVEFRLTGVNANAERVTLSTRTDANGEFWFENLTPSVNGRGAATGYTIEEIVPTGFLPTTLSMRGVNLGSGQELVWRDGAAMLPTPPVATVDQQSTQSDTIAESNGGPLGQTFTPAVTGALTEVAIRSPGVASPAMILEIQTLAPQVTSSGTEFVPTGISLASATATAGDDGNLIFEFTDPPQLLAGFEYGLVLRSMTPQQLSWAFGSGDTYDAGVRLIRTSDGRWQREANQDYAFTTTMIASGDPRVEVLADSDADGTGDELMFGNRSGETEIRWRKETKSGFLGGVTFELTQTHSYSQFTGNFTDIVDVVTSVTDNLPPDGNSIFGLFAVTGIPFGRYTLRETGPIPGYDLDPFVQTFEITNADPNQDSPHIYVNRLAKRAYIGSTVALRLAYQEQIGSSEPTLDGQPIGTTTSGNLTTRSEVAQPSLLPSQFVSTPEIVPAITPTKPPPINLDVSQSRYVPTPEYVSPSLQSVESRIDLVIPQSRFVPTPEPERAITQTEVTSSNRDVSQSRYVPTPEYVSPNLQSVESPIDLVIPQSRFVPTPEPEQAIRQTEVTPSNLGVSQSRYVPTPEYVSPSLQSVESPIDLVIPQSRFVPTPEPEQAITQTEVTTNNWDARQTTTRESVVDQVIDEIASELEFSQPVASSTTSSHRNSVRRLISSFAIHSTNLATNQDDEPDETANILF